MPSYALQPLWLLLLLCAACAGLALPEVEGEPAAARVQLAAAAASGPVPVIVRDAPPTVDPDLVAAALARGVRGLEVRFEPAGRVRPAAVVVEFAQALPDQLCRSELAPSDRAAAAEPALLLVWCGDEEAVASVGLPLTSTAPAEIERALARAAARLFPDDYAERYGIDLFGLRIGIGASVGF